GAKGGAYARISAASLKKDGKPLPTFYTPHGGALHYDPKTLQGRIFFGFERMAQKWTRAILFESHYGFGVYRRKIGEPTCPATVIHNGVGRADFVPVVPSGDAVDLLFIGELRQLKGVSDLLAALAILRDRGQRVAAVLVGSGPDEEVFKAEAQSLGLSERVRFAGAMPAREAFALARAIAVPSRNESLPYVVLEAAAAGLPMVATTVGGIPEIFAGEAHRLVPPSDPGRLADAIARLVDAPDRARAEAAILQETVRTRFSVSVMTDGVLKAYAEYGGLAGIAAADSRNRESAIPSVAEI
ncbi:MAG: glycosyltransferase family 4 protein, partial [Rhodobiaceae bacterium]|nr:glycosyltransferase family 4 protein [Rhodobiaceae bacterium]